MSVVSNEFTRKWIAFLSISLLSFGCYLDYTVVNLALPAIQVELNADLISLQWVMNVYFIALCSLALLIGYLGDVFGRRRCFYLGSMLFAIASFIAGFAPDIDWLIVGRLLQGIGAATVFPLGLSLLPVAFPEKERDLAISYFGAIGGIALALGPVLGGFIVSCLGWRWVFFINIPIIILGYVFAFISIKESAPQSKIERFDFVKMSKDFYSPLFISGCLLGLTAGVLSSVTLFFDTLYLQVIKNLTPQMTGLVLFAIPLSVFIISFFISRFISHYGVAKCIVIGLAFACFATFLQLFFSDSTSICYILFSFISLGAIWAFGNSVSIIAAQAAVNKSNAGIATGSIVTFFNIGGALGLMASVAIYHFLAESRLETLSRKFLISNDQVFEIKNLILNPAHLLQVEIGNGSLKLFNTLFLSGFSGVTWFLFFLSLTLLFAVRFFILMRQ